MKTGKHILQERLPLLVKEQAILTTAELRHVARCPECVKAWASAIDELLAANQTNKSQTHIHSNMNSVTDTRFKPKIWVSSSFIPRQT